LYSLCGTCNNELHKLTSPLVGEAKQYINIDKHHTYLVGKHGPVIKCTINDKTTFKAVKKDLDMDKLQRGEYNLEDIEEKNKITGKLLGIHKGKQVLLKSGKFGLYIAYGEESKSLSQLTKDECDIELRDVIPYLEITRNKNILRELTNNLSIRQGKYGSYIYYKTVSMTKPSFLKLQSFKENAITCDLSTILDWIKTNHSVS